MNFIDNNYHFSFNIKAEYDKLMVLAINLTHYAINLNNYNSSLRNLLFYLLLNLIKTPENKIKYFQRSLGVVLILHMVSLSDLMLIDNGLDLSLFKTFTLIAFIINAVIFISSFNKSLHSMFLVLFPISTFSLLMGHFVEPTKTLTNLSAFVQSHIIISFLSYSFLAIAALHSMMTGYYHLQLKQKNQNFLIKSFPPLQTMENFLFQLIWIGVILLTLSLGSGFLIL